MTLKLMDLKVKDYIIFGNNVSVIFPSSIVGGHELMAIEIIKDFISNDIDVTVYIEPTNRRLFDLFNDFKKVSKLPVFKRRIESISALFDPFYVYKIENFLKKEIMEKSYTSIIIIQGDIEIGSPYVVAAKKQNIKLISYIPFTHTKSKMHKPLAFIRDHLDSILYTYVDRYITIYSAAAKDLYIFNPKSENFIIKNKVRDLSEFKVLKVQKKISKKLKIYIVGRVEFIQKGHDRLVNVLKNLDEKIIINLEINVIGDGPDLATLQNDLSKITHLDYKFHGWMSEPWLKAYEADLIVIPSRFEGVPLVMLEALELDIPVIASKIDGMVDYLKDDSLFSDDIDFEKKIINHIEFFMKEN